MFSYKTKIRIYDTDAAGVIFYGSQFRLMQEAYEELIERAGYGIDKIIGVTPFTLPVVHAEADYLTPSVAGDEIEIQLTLGILGGSSYTMNYELRNQSGALIGKGKTVHVAIDKTTRKKIPLPDDFIAAVKALCQ